MLKKELKSNFRLSGFCIFDATDDSQFESGAKMCENATSSQHLLFTAQTAELISYWGFEIMGHILQGNTQYMYLISDHIESRRGFAVGLST